MKNKARKTRRILNIRTIVMMFLLMMIMAVPSIVTAADTSAIIPYQGYYNPNADAYWDTMTSGKQSASGGVRENAKVEYVKINNVDVEWSHAKYGMVSGYHGNGNGKSLPTYFPGANTTKEVYSDIVIKANAGYYVERVVIACTHYSPFFCETWELENAYDENFRIDVDGTLTIKDVSSKFFSHVPSSDRKITNNYFVLIELAPLPSPLYVEYDYGQFEEGVPVSGDAFATADGWLDDSDKNKYGTGEIQTNDTQFKYAYNPALTGNAAANAAASWQHFANNITPEAAKDAEKAGYKFVGWKAEYYKTATASRNSNGSYNNYTYRMSDMYGTGTYGKGDQVSLVSHVKLIAQWEKEPYTSVSVTKVWDDANNQDGKRPESITFNLFADGNKIASKTVTAANNWSWTFENLEKNKNYTVEEEPVAGYETKITGDAETGYTVTNKYTPAKISVSGKKVWNDADNQDGKRPGSITINLFANGNKVGSKTVTAADNWLWDFQDLDKYSEGKVINYTVEEEAIADYETEITGDAETGFTVTNTHTIEKISVSGRKVWDDADNQDGKRPENITINLLADGKPIDSATVSEKTQWTWTFSDLEKYKDGKEITYTFSEKANEDYSTIYETTRSEDGKTITNKYTPKKTSVTVSKTWNDGSNRDGKRPGSVKVALYADGKETNKTLTLSDANEWIGSFTELPVYNKGNEIEYSIKEVKVSGYETDIAGDAKNGYTITNTYEPEIISIPVKKSWDDADNQDGKRPESITVNLFGNGELVESALITEDSDWEYTFENLFKYENGKEIVYTVTENAVENYEENPAISGNAASGFVIVNKHEPEKTFVKGSKTWDDAENQDGKRPESITVNLLANGNKIDSRTVTAADKWSWHFENLDKFKNGKAIIYTIEENDVEGYEEQVVGHDVINKHEPEKTFVKGSKTWDDAGNQDGKRPESITITLFADGQEVDSKVVTAADKWEWLFTDLDKYSNGKEIEYTITESDVPEYEESIDGYNAINTHEPEKISVKGSKTWNDADNQDGKRPESITVNLLANGNKIDSKTVTEATQWTWAFENLDKYANGKEIVYTFTEDAIENYSATYSDDKTQITNSYTPEQTSVTVSKVWNDDEDRDGIRPDSVVIELLADNEPTGKTVTLSEANNWQDSFTELDVYKNKGQEIIYSVVEYTVEGYETVITGDAKTGYAVTNTNEPELTSVKATKTWDDADNQDGIRPESISLNLFGNGEFIESKTVTEGDNWTVTFDNLFKYEGGEEIIYTVTEEPVEGYKPEINGMDIINVHELETTEITINKMWAGDSIGDRPESISVNVYADGELFETVELTAADGWKFTLSDMPKYREGKVGEEIEYTISEIDVPGYTSNVNGYTITNVYITEVKTGDDNGMINMALLMMMIASTVGMIVVVSRRREA